MIDAESKVYDTVSTAVLTAFQGAFVSNEYVSSPSSFPHVTVEQIDSYASVAERTATNTEEFANVSYEINVYSNKTSGKKAEAKSVMAVADATMISLGFTRTMLSPLPNIKDSTIYRLTARYSARIAMVQNGEIQDFYIYHNAGG